MKKLQVKQGDSWAFVFCNNGGRVVTTADKSKALPTLAAWGADDLAYFQGKFANSEFRLSAAL